jgi:uncharacterized Zn finger protein (UPF0148 family)
VGFLAPDPGDPGEARVDAGSAAGASLGEHRRLVRDGAQVLAHGALVCPECGLPIAVTRRLPATGALRCGFCDHTAEAHRFIREDVFDTVENEVYLVARVAA